MKKSVIVVLTLAALSATASAQDVKAGQEKTSFEKRSFPFEGDVTVERLNVRMFPKGDANSIITSVLGLGDKVTVLAEKDEYYQIDLSTVVGDFQAAQSKAQTETVRAEAERGLERYREVSRIWAAAKHQIEERHKLDAEKLKLAEELKKTEPPATMFQGYIDSTGLLFKRPGTHKLVMGGRIICFLRIKDGDEKMLTRLNDGYQRFVGINGTVITNPDGWDGYKVVVVEELIKLEKDKE